MVGRIVAVATSRASGDQDLAARLQPADRITNHPRRQIGLGPPLAHRACIGIYSLLRSRRRPASLTRKRKDAATTTCAPFCVASLVSIAKPVKQRESWP
jgi:hypothetical protein